MTEIVPFSFDGDDVRVLVVDDEPWWIARDVCTVLDIQNNRDALSSLDDDEKGVATADTPGGPQQLATINEPGLYSLIFRSRKPEAKAFKRWVTHEVLPQIRRTGRYDTAARPDYAAIEAQSRILAVQTAAGLVDRHEARRQARELRVQAGIDEPAEHPAVEPTGDPDVDGAATAILRVVTRNGTWTPRGDIRRCIWHRHRPLFDAAVTHLETAGLLDAKPITHQGQNGTAYRAAAHHQNGDHPR